MLLTFPLEVDPHVVATDDFVHAGHDRILFTWSCPLSLFLAWRAKYKLAIAFHHHVMQVLFRKVSGHLATFDLVKIQ